MRVRLSDYCVLLITLAGVVGLDQSDDPKVHYGGPNNTLQVWTGPVCLCKNYILITQSRPQPGATVVVSAGVQQ